MSSILKALEKAEESTSGKRMAGDSDLIRSRKARPRWVMPVAVLSGAAVATLVTFAAMGGFSRPAPGAKAPLAVAKSTPVKLAPSTQVIETPAIAPERSASAAALQAPVLSGPQAAALAKPKAAPLATLKAVPVAALKAVSPANSKSAPVLGSKSATSQSPKVRAAKAGAPQPVSQQPAAPQPAPVQSAPVPVAAAAPASAHPEPKVSGIAWQNNGESSFAVVNGRAVLQGGMVDGYKVLEIHQDSVKFSGANGNIEVPLGGDEK